MAMSLDTLISKANRKLDVSGMRRDVADRTRAVIKQMHAQGIYICVAQGYRSIAEQNELYAQGRTKPGSIVTNAKGGQSNHNFGVAIDLCLYTQDGSDVIWTVEGDFRKVVNAMKAQGFKWGGDWTSFKDYPHFELYNVVDGQKPPADTGGAVDTGNGGGSNSGGTSSDGSIGVAYIEGLNVNLRSGPGTGYGVIRKLNKPESYIVWAEKDGWLNLGGDQWVYNDSDYIRFQRTGGANKVPEAPAPAPAGPLGTAYIRGYNVNLRSGPGTGYSVIRQLSKGESYVVWAKQNGWLNLGGNQWVYNDPSYINFIEE
ncbi:endolysin [Bacillus phage Deep Blue]|uniref:Endolysin n=1 Tax=Bacillus phage Deep Blue TaxID=1792245 RepID=A0A140HM31_9CAUD|nr:endolysin [Bacillus phage Deep Blue]AMO26043.1 endolysin [Bacillus phage Deep Blue]